MQKACRTLVRLRRTAVGLLLAQHLFKWMSSLLFAALICGWVDHLLRLPRWPRLVIALIIAIIALTWLIGRLVQVAGFRPSLGALALRLEQIYPQFKGMLASGVEFAMAVPPEGKLPEGRTDHMMIASLQQLQGKLDDGESTFGRLIKPALSLRMGMVLAVAVAVMTGVAVAAPQQFEIAAWRWLAPLGATKWPKRTGVESMIKKTAWPIDTPLRLAARVQEGYRPGIRMWVHYRLLVEDADRRWHTTLMNDQGDDARRGRFECLLDLVAVGLNQDEAGTAVEFYFAAGDDQTDPQQLDLIARPAVRSVRLEFDPPAYARGLIDPQTVALDEQSGPVATAAALAGTDATLLIELNKPLPLDRFDLSRLVPGLPGDAGIQLPTVSDQGDPYASQVRISFRLDESLETLIHLSDEHGLADLSERRYRIEAIEDKSPAVSLLEPSADQSVLATAVVPVVGVAQDDVAVSVLRLEAEPRRGSKEASSESAGPALQLEETTGRNERLRTSHTFDLAPLKLASGDTVELRATAVDVFELDGRTHPIAHSASRLLRVIDEAALASQIRFELAVLRQQAVRVQRQQEELMQASGEEAVVDQQRLGRSLSNQQALLGHLTQRMHRNRMDDEVLQQLVDDAATLLKQAGVQSEAAQQNLQQAQEKSQQSQVAQARQQAKGDQQQVRDTLEKLINLLDQGRNALALQAKLQDLAVKQRGLRQDTRKMMPRTLGRNQADLNDQEQQELADLARQQSKLAEQARVLTGRMQAAAEALSQQGTSTEAQAAAQALREAAAVAQRQGLNPTMQEAARLTENNQLSQAGSQQDTVQDVLDEMLDELNSQQRRRQEILRRRLMKLADAIAKLVEQQEAQLERLEKALKLAGLDRPLESLRRNTLDVGDHARQSRETADAAQLLASGAERQGEAVVAIRGGDRPQAQSSEQQALAHLRQAREQVDKLQQKTEQEQNRRERQELRKTYEQLADQQEKLRSDTEPFEPVERIGQRQRAVLRELAGRQSEIRLKAGDLAQQSEKTLIFRHLHERIDQMAGSAAESLRSGKVVRSTLGEQQQIAQALRAMAEALKEEQSKSDFADRQAGASGGGGLQPPPLIPPIAELKLLRSLQQEVYHATEQAGGEGHLEVDGQALLDLSVRQRELASLGEQLIQQMQENQQPQGPPPIQRRTQ